MLTALLRRIGTTFDLVTTAMLARSEATMQLADAAQRGELAKQQRTLILDLPECDDGLLILKRSVHASKAGRISITAPIARALIGKSVGDAIEVSTPKGAKSYEILKLQYK